MGLQQRGRMAGGAAFSSTSRVFDR
jgi:hypothetical protein